MSKLKYLIVAAIIFLFFFNQSAVAQDYKKLMGELRKKNETTDRLHVIMHVQAYENETATSPFYQDKVTILRDGHNYLYTMRANEMLLNDSYMIMVDKEMKQISCTRRDVKSEENINKSMMFNMDSVLNQYGNPEFIGNIDQTSHYQFKQEEGTMRSMDIFINESKNIIQKIEYRYEDSQYVIVRFDAFDFNAEIPVGAFAENKYVKIVNGKCFPAQSFQKYEMIGNSF